MSFSFLYAFEVFCGRVFRQPCDPLTQAARNAEDRNATRTVSTALTCPRPAIFSTENWFCRRPFHFIYAL